MFQLNMLILLKATVVEPPFAGVARQTQRPFARVTVGGFLGENFEKLSITLPDTFDIRRFKVGETWIFPLSRIEGDDKRRVYYRLRTDREGQDLLQQVPNDWLPVSQDIDA